MDGTREHNFWLVFYKKQAGGKYNLEVAYQDHMYQRESYKKADSKEKLRDLGGV